MRLSASLLVYVGMGNSQSRPWIVSDELWSLIEPLLPKPGPKKVQGRPRVPDRQALSGILFVLHTGIQWEYLPQELGFGSEMTCWRRLAAWNEAGVWDRLHVLLLNELRSKNQLDWERAVIDSSHVRAARRGPKAGPARSTAHGRAASTTSSSTDRASRSRCR
ncbi:transposase [Streptomyces sp. BK208]|nr:transposase [Streptomyces sp. BK208]